MDNYSSSTSNISGLMSGTDWNSLIDSLMQLKRRPLTLLENKKKLEELRLSTWNSVSSILNSAKSIASSNNSIEDIIKKNATSSDTDIVTVSADSTAINGTHTIKVSQLALQDKIASQGWDESTGIASSNGYLNFSVGSGSVTSIAVNSSMTISQLANAINESDGDLTATVVNDGSAENNYRLILTGKDSGSSNTITITQNDSDLDFTNARIDEAELTDWTSTNSTATSNEGTGYTGTENKTFYFTASNSTADVTTTAAVINWTDSEGNSGSVTINAYNTNFTVAEGVQIQLDNSSGNNVTVDETFQIDVFNPDLQNAQDAKFYLDGIYMTRSDNSVSDAIDGLTMNLQGVDSTKNVEISISTDTAKTKENIVDIINKLNEFENLYTSMTWYNSEENQGAPLQGDSTLIHTKFGIDNILSSRIPGLTSGVEYDSLAAIGIEYDNEGKVWKIDDTELTSAINSDEEAVAKLFTFSDSSTNNSIRYFYHTEDTDAGDYTIVANFDASGTLTSGTINGHAATVDGSKLIAANNTQEEGLQVWTEYHGNASETTTLNLTFGVNEQLETYINQLTNSVDGQITTITKSIQSKINNYDEEIESWEERLEKIRSQYIYQFTQMEITIAKLQSQQQDFSKLG